METISTRTLSGEIWWELEKIRRVDSRLQEIDHDLFHQMIDLITGVIARHENSLLVRDEDIPAKPWDNDSWEM